MTSPHSDLDAFRSEANEFLLCNAEPRSPDRAAWGEGDDTVAIPLVSDASVDLVSVSAEARAWQQRCFDAGYGWIDGPVELGGRGLPSEFHDAFREASAAFELPDDAFVRTGTSVLGPTILRFGSDDAVRAHLKRVHRGEDLVCQLFSEPDAGSDLANVQTRARPLGDASGEPVEWSLSGQKVWSSGAQFADLGVCLARTSREDRKHAGLTMFLVDMHAPGITVRPTVQITGGAEFCEVFLEDVRVPDAYRLGHVGEGWAVTMHALMSERAAIGLEALPDPALVERLVDLARHLGRTVEPLVRQSLADIHVRLTVARCLAARLHVPGTVGRGDGAEGALTKIAVSDVFRRIADAAGMILGARLIADSSEWGTFAWTAVVLGAPALSIGGGTDEVLRNGIGERILGLPREAR